MNEITDSVIEDICAVAFEGGINYWVCEADQLSKFPIHFTTYEMVEGLEGPNPAPLTRQGLVTEIMKERAKSPHSPIEEWLGDVDADVADQIVQRAVFGEQIYG